MKKDDEWDDELFMGDSEKELRMIFQGQESMSDSMRSLNQKMDEIIGELKTKQNNIFRYLQKVRHSVIENASHLAKLSGENGLKGKIVSESKMEPNTKELFSSLQKETINRK